MRYALHAEWTKARTVAGPAWLLLAVALLTIGLGAVVAEASALASSASAALAAHQSEDGVKLTLGGVQLSQAVVAILAVQAVSGEYATGMIRSTLTAIPRRGVALAAKACVTVGLACAAAVPAVFGAFLLGRAILVGHGYTQAAGYPAMALTAASTLRATLGSVLYLALIALLSMGIAVLVRESAIAIGAVLALLYLFPLLAHVVSDPVWQRHLLQIGPMSAGLLVQNTTGVSTLPLSPWAGLGVLAAWAAAAVAAGAFALRRRDA
ncbi:ABC transporter permease [Actinospica durhamensis]|uniref:ABC transporter permease n=1 Tax=Actinospica durhamensis TaxID=1508375 RepID=A0A941ITP8_9ACTN|nr:ABC transporter permease [Actinospica durhamensis]MBR7834566.1 ABC transporter permease [Actinospica durhamensis]